MEKMRAHIVSRGVAIAIALLVVLTAPGGAAVRAQTETGQITGTVTDPTGAVIAGATVIVRSPDTGAERTVTTTGEGLYTVANLQPGLYEVSVTAAGFTEQRLRAQVVVGQPTGLDAQLGVGGSVGEVNVVAGEEGVQVNTETQTLQTTVTQTQVRELPTISRNPYQLVQLAGNTTEDNAPPGAQRGVGFAINGQRAASTNVLLDGSSNNDEFTASVGQTVPLDSVQEFSVITSNFTPEFGRAAGGVVNVVTRSGTNEFHGTIYEFNRNAALATANFEDNAVVVGPGESPIEKAQFNRNQFGFSIGGPIVTDKVLFFTNNEWLRTRSTLNARYLVPTSQLLAASAPATQAFFNAFPLSTPINGQILTVGQVGTGAGAFANLGASFPAFGIVNVPTPADVGAGTPGNTYLVSSRVDVNFTDRTTMYVRHALEKDDFFSGTNSASPYAGFNTGIDAFNNNGLISVTHVWSDTFVTQSKAVYNRLNQHQPLGDQPAVPTLYAFANTAATVAGTPLAFPGYLPLNPGSAIPFGGPQNYIQFYQDANSTFGTHQLRFGGTYIRVLDNRTFGAYETAVETLGSSLTQSLNNLVSGQLLQFQAAIDPQGAFPLQTITLPATAPSFERNNRYNEFALYLNDSWKIRPRLTLNLGLRYEYFGVQHNTDENLDANFYFGDGFSSGATLQEQIANGQVLRAPDSPIGRLWRPDWNNVGPRLGVAWDVFGDGKTSARGGYGIQYERNFGNVTFNVIQNPPNYAVISILGPEVGLDTLPIFTSNTGPLTGTGSVTLPPSSLRGVDPNIKTAYAHVWDAAVEHQFGTNTVVGIQYSGSHGSNLYSISTFNRPFEGAYYLGTPIQGQPGAVSTNPFGRINGQYGTINLRSNQGFSNYNGVTMSLESRDFGHTGLAFTAKYTYSHALDNLSSTFSETGNAFNVGVLDPYNPRLDYGNADFDVRHRFVTSGIWETPWSRFVGDNTWAKNLLGGWTLSYIFTARSGYPFSVYDCTNGFSVCTRLLEAGGLQLNGNNDAQASRLPQDIATGNRYTYIDLSNQLSQAGSYVNPYLASLGVPISDFGPFPSNMTARNAFRGPGIWNLDGGIYKNIGITEKVSLQLRGEFYNVFNHPNLYVSGAEADISSSSFVPAFRSGRRQIQLAAKLVF